jgi:hypothetical protein
MSTLTTTCNIGELFRASGTYPILYNYLIIIVYKIILRPGTLFEIKVLDKQIRLTQKCEFMSTVFLYIFYFIVGLWIYRLLAYFYDRDPKESYKTRKQRF